MMAAAAAHEQSDLSQPEYIKTIVTKPHHATDHTQIELKVNDIVFVLEQDETGWWGGFKEGEDQTGWFPGSCVRPIVDQSLQSCLATQEAISSAVNTQEVDRGSSAK